MDLHLNGKHVLVTGAAGGVGHRPVQVRHGPRQVALAGTVADRHHERRIEVEPNDPSGLCVRVTWPGVA